MRRIGLAAIVLCVTAGAAAEAAEVVALGASNTFGRGRGSTPDGVNPGQAYPAQLERMLNAQGCRVRVLNAGVAGNTTAQMLARMNGVLGKDTRVLILQPGGNDQRRGGGGDRSANIAEMRRRATARGIKVVMLDSLGQIAGAYRLADKQHFSAQGHAAFAAYLAPQVRAAGACG